MTATVLILIYCVIFAYLIRRLRFFEQTGLKTQLLLGLFGVKVTAGILYGFIHKNFFSGGDTFLYFAESQQLAATFAEHPLYCLQSLFGFSADIPSADVYLYPPAAIFWKDLGTYFIIHINAALIPFSGGVYEVHVVFMAMLGTIASALLYKTLKSGLNLSNNLLITACFLLPSLLFWTAGIHKDVFLFFGLSLLMWSLHSRRWLGFGLGLLIMGLTRHYSLLLLCPALMGYFFAQSAPRFVGFKVLLAGAGGLFLLMLVDYHIFNNFIINILAQKQNAFINETGSSDFRNLQPFDNYWGLISQLPSAFSNVVARPLFWEFKHIWQLLAGVEMGFFWCFVLLMMLFPKQLQYSPMAYFMLFFSLSYLLLIGFLVANEGTMVRYRAIPLSFLTILIWQATNWATVQNWLSRWVGIRSDKFKLYP